MRLRLPFAVQFLRAEAATTGNVRARHGITGHENRMRILASSSIPSLAIARKRAEPTALTALIPLPLREANRGQPDGMEKNFPDPHSFLMHSSSIPYELFALLALIRSDRATSWEVLNTGQSWT
jgi:hypothetical protein